MNDLSITPLNMHMHSHFSYNAEGLSPRQLVERALQNNLYSMAICDFDVLDGLEEFYAASDPTPLKASAGMETRVFFSEYGDKEINSPGEPGVYYFMGMGFSVIPPAKTLAGKTLAELRRRSAERNAALIGRINAAYPEISIDYERQVLPLTPSGNATERHIVAAYAGKIASLPDSPQVWARVLKMGDAKVETLIQSEAKLHNALRSALMKSGGVGYVKPDSSTFPPLEDVVAMILDARAIPMATWLNGLSAGEADMATQLDCLRSKGIAALNIIPDRNWNIADPEEKALKVKHLHEVVRIAKRMELPINVGTELNAPGQPFVDDFAAEPMKPLWPSFLRGANIIIGHTRMLRFARFSYCGPKAAQEFGADIPRKNEFFARVGMLPNPDMKMFRRMMESGPEKAYAAIQDAVRSGKWVD